MVGQTSRLNLHEGWKFRIDKGKIWRPATVPGCVHTDLMANQLIRDPFHSGNEEKVQWVSQAHWEYALDFELSPSFLEKEKVDLVFEGLDTYAAVRLNGHEILQADNMFRPWRIPVRDKLLARLNRLQVFFRSPIREVLPLLRQANPALPAPRDIGEKTSPYTRKAPYQYGWDWGPRLVTSGIWRPVYLEAWDQARIGGLQVIQTQLEKESARLIVYAEILAASPSEAELKLDCAGRVPVSRSAHLKLQPGLNRIPLDLVIPHPRLWWPNGLGKQELYRIQARLSRLGKLLDKTEMRFGLRTLSLRQEADQRGRSFAFVINNVPVFAKGANWIPADSFPTRVTRERYRHLLESAQASHMNMLRVWGGGIYEADDFYQLCDELGLLVWQDFMFSCAFYPSDTRFLQNVTEEATAQIRRLRHHPSLALWCGNNEIETAWEHWGWKKELPASGWQDYWKIFHALLPRLCASLDPSRPYWPSSPSSNREADPDSRDFGDLHFWGVWHGEQPFEAYRNEKPRFMSEYGFQSFPRWETITSFAAPSQLELDSAVMRHHQKNPGGNLRILKYLSRDYPPPKNFASLIYLSQLMQAEGIRIGAEHLRRQMPHTMGSLYWQLDDCWPGITWSSIDYWGRWKALQYYARRFYDDLLITVHPDAGELKFSVVSDKTVPLEAQLKIQLLDFSGQLLLEQNFPARIPPLNSHLLLARSEKQLLQGKNSATLVLHCELWNAGQPASSCNYFFVPTKRLQLPVPGIHWTLAGDSRKVRVLLAAERLARAVFLRFPRHKGYFSDNFFDLLAGAKKELFFFPEEKPSLEELRQELEVTSLKDMF
jgi:beta-mannosidase